MNANFRTNLAYTAAVLAGLALLAYCFVNQSTNQYIDSLATAAGGGLMAAVLHYRNNRPTR